MENIHCYSHWNLTEIMKEKKPRKLNSVYEITVLSLKWPWILVRASKEILHSLGISKHKFFQFTILEQAVKHPKSCFEKTVGVSEGTWVHKNRFTWPSSEANGIWSLTDTQEALNVCIQHYWIICRNWTHVQFYSCLKESTRAFFHIMLLLM